MSQSGPVAPPSRRFSIAGLMALTAAVGVTFAAARWLGVTHPPRAIALIPSAIVLEFAASGWLRSRGLRRWAWGGFTLTGLTALASFLATEGNGEAPAAWAWKGAAGAVAWALFGGLQLPKPPPAFNVGANLLALGVAIHSIIAGLSVAGGIVGLVLGRLLEPPGASGSPKTGPPG